MNHDPKPHIYFICPVGAEGPIKVGYSSSVPVRLQSYAKWSPVPLELAAALCVPDNLSPYGAHGGVCGQLERRFHIRYQDYRLHHEWFAAHPLILDDIDAINAGTFDIARLPEWRRVSNDFMRREYPNGQSNGRPRAAA